MHSSRSAAGWAAVWWVGDISVHGAARPQGNCSQLSSAGCSRCTDSCTLSPCLRPDASCFHPAKSYAPHPPFFHPPRLRSAGSAAQGRPRVSAGHPAAPRCAAGSGCQPGRQAVARVATGLAAFPSLRGTPLIAGHDVALMACPQHVQWCRSSLHQVATHTRPMHTPKPLSPCLLLQLWICAPAWTPPAACKWHSAASKPWTARLLCPLLFCCTRCSRSCGTNRWAMVARGGGCLSRLQIADCSV